MPSQKFLKEEAKRHATDIDRVDFRDKRFEQFTFSINEGGKIVYNQNWINNPYYYTFMKSITFRENCYSCKYATSSRCSDITVGDFWGLSKDSNLYRERKKGVSVVLPITKKGLLLIEEISNDIINKEERTIEEAVKGNTQLRYHTIKDKKVDKFKKIYKKNNNFTLTYKMVCTKNYIKQIIKSNKIIHYLMKKIGEKNVK